MKFDRSLRPQIGNNVMLGTDCKVLGGIQIGDDVTGGANSVILNSVEPNQTVFGVPAKERSSSPATTLEICCEIVSTRFIGTPTGLRSRSSASTATLRMEVPIWWPDAFPT